VTGDNGVTMETREQSSHARRVWALLQPAVVACCAAVCGLSPLRAEDDTTRYFQQLRRRGLFRLAEGVCFRKLARDDLTIQERSQYTLEFSRTLAEHAKYTTGKEQDELWKQATAVVEDFLKEHPEAPRRRWLRLQKAVVLVLQGEFRRWDAQLFPYDSRYRTAALKTLDRAEAELQQLQRQLAGNAGTSNTGSGARDGSEGGLLRRHIRYQRSIVLVNRAELHKPESAERRQAVQQAQALLSRLAGGPASADITHNSRFFQAVLSRLRGEHRKATNQLKAVQKRAAADGLRHRIVAELIRILLEKDHAEHAAEMLTSYQKTAVILPGELAYLKVKTSAALWKAARERGDDTTAEQWLKQAERDVAEADRFLGGYWAYRCRLLLDFLKESRKYGPELTGVLRAARSAFRTDNHTTALKHYRRAISLAEQSNQTELAVELRFTTASLHLETGDYKQAAAEFERVTNRYPEHKRAAEADLMRAYCLGRVYHARRTKSRRLAYTQALQAHRRRYSDSPTIHEAAWMLAALYDYRRQTRDALELYLSIPREHRRGLAAQAEAARCYEEILTILRNNNAEPLAEWEQHAAARLGTFVKQFPPAPKAWNSLQTQIALRTARIHLNRKPPQYSTAEPLLQRVLTAAETVLKKNEPAKDERSEWERVQQQAQQMHIVALAGSGRLDDAEALVHSLSESGPGELLPVLDGLMRIGAQSDEQLRNQLGALQLKAALQLDKRRNQFDSHQQRWLDRCLAQAHAATGRPEEAARRYEQLLAQSPRNKQLLRSAAELLSNARSREMLLKARTYWRKLEALNKPGSRQWLTARYHVALCNYRMAEYTECRKLIDVTKLLYPQLGGEALRKRFERLSADVKDKLAEE